LLALVQAAPTNPILDELDKLYEHRTTMETRESVKKSRSPTPKNDSTTPSIKPEKTLV